MVAVGDAQTIQNASLHIIRNIKSTIGQTRSAEYYCNKYLLIKKDSPTIIGQAHSNTLL